MEYLLIVCEDPTARAALAPAERAGVLVEYGALTAALRADGRFVAGRALEGTTTATTVRVRAGRRLVSDGPFAETREHVVGYYVIEAADLDQAIALAARVPAARFGAVEVRPVRRVA